MATTSRWNFIKPTQGVLNWDVPINENYELLDQLLHEIRTNFASTTDPGGPQLHNEEGSLWYSKLDAIGRGLFVRTDIGYTKLLDQDIADGRYISKLHEHIYVDGFKAGAPTQGEMLHIYVARNSFLVPLGMVGTYAKALNTGSSTTVLTLALSLNDGSTFSNVGTLTFGAGNRVADVTTYGPVNVRAGDILKLTATTVGNGIANITWNLKTIPT